MGQLGQIEWATWIQAVAALAALGFVPATAKAIWAKLRYKFNARCWPSGTDAAGATHTWQIDLENASKSLRKLKATVYADGELTTISSFSIATPNDAGLYVKKSSLKGGGLRLNIERIGPGRICSIRVVFSRPAQPRIFSGNFHIDRIIEREQGIDIAATVFPLETVRQRSWFFVIYLAILYAIVVARMLYLLLFG